MLRHQLALAATPLSCRFTNAVAALAGEGAFVMGLIESGRVQ